MLPLIPQKGFQDNAISPEFRRNINQIKSKSNSMSYEQSYHPIVQSSDDFQSKRKIDSYQNIHKSIRNKSVIIPQARKNPHFNKIKQQLSRMKPTYNVCNNQKCKVCKPIITSRKQIQYYHHKKMKPPLPSFPALKSSSVKKYSRQPQNYQNKPRHLRVRSVIQAEPNDLYIYQQPIIRQKKLNYEQLIKYKIPPRHYYTQPQQIERKIFQINGKYYESFDERQLTQDVQQMPSPIRRQRKPQVLQLIQPIMRYSQKWKNQQVEKVKTRQQLNKWVNQYINYQTVFFMESRGVKMNFNENVNIQYPNKGQNIQRYKLKSVSKQIQKLPINQQKYYDPQEMIENFLQLVPIQPTQTNIQKKKVVIKQQIKNDGQISQIYQIKFPSVAEVQLSISKYESLTGQINIESLRQSKNYFREYCDQLNKEYLYFGDYDHIKLERKGFGVLVTKNFILEGKWAKGNIIQGAELKSKFIYKGQFKNNKKHGDGSCKWVNGQTYVGEWENGLKNGHGSWTSFNGNQTYSGEWKKGKVTGHGEYCIKNKSLYKGFFIDFIKHGHGLQQFLNGDKYQGEYANGYPSGKGIYTWECGLKYEGQFKKGCREGKGCLKKQQIFQIEGEFQNQKPHGICQLKLTNGDIFNGKYVFGQKYGFGTLQYNNSALQEQGFWNHDILQQKLSLQTFLKKNS